ncbi:MAG: SdrD B-like domain-containing protein [Spirosomataceae bacterium]
MGQLDPFSTHKMTQYENSPYASFYGGPINPGTTFWNYISVDNQGGGLPLQNPVIMDLLPLGLDYNGTITYSPGTPTADVTDIIPNFNGTGRTLIRLKWTSPMPAGTSYKLNIAVKVTSLAPAGLASSYTANQKFYSPYTEINGIKNTAFFSGSSPAQCFIPQYFTKPQVAVADIYDLNSNGSTIDTLCYSSDYVGITSSAQMSSVKWVKGQCDTDYSKYPAFGQTMPGGIANYKLIVTNTGNVPTKDIQILDILPFVGDAGVIDPNARLTQWRPNLVTPLQTPPGVTVYYSTASNPCRTDYVLAGPAGCSPANWTTVLPQDPTTIQSLKLDFGTTVLQPGDQVELTWDMRAPVTGVTTGDIAWNSFGFKATRADNNDPFLPSEPFKVGIKLKDNIPGNYGDFVWLDANKNGIQDSGELGVDGVRVELHQDNGDGINDPKTDPVIAFTSTANGGQYLFPNLAVGNYYAVFFLPAGYSTSAPNATADDKDSDGIPTICNGNRVTVVPITNIGSGETDLTWDQGIYPDKAAVGNYVWFDENQNNLQDESSANGINGVRVCLYTAAGTLVATDTTSNDIYGRPGYYLFDQLDPGSYYVQFKPTADKTYTPNSGSAGGSSSDETDSDADPATGKTATFTLAAGQIDLTWDAGLIIQTGPYKLGNYVWNDTNNNGKVDTGEAGVNNVTVNLYNDRNNDSKPQPDEFVTTTITGTVGGVNGIYVFDRLPTGNYIVQIPDANFSGVLKDYTSSTGNDPAPDPDDNVENDDNGTAVAGCGIISKPITLANAAEPLDGGYTNYTVDFGFYKCNKPDYTASVTQPTCAGGKGSILLGTGTVGDKVAFTTGDPSTIATYANATLISSLTGGLIVGNIANPAADVTYTIRVYNGEDGCFKDFTFIIKSLNCCTKPVAKATPKTQTICSGSTATAYTITPSTGVQYQWYGPLADTTGSLGTAISGQTAAAYTPTGAALITAGTKYYAVVVNTTGDPTCADTAFVQLIINAKPTIADGNATICAGEAVDLTSKITNYNTYLSPVWTIGTAGGTAVATPTSVKPTTTTTYVLVAQNAAGCKDTAQVVVTVNPKPNAGTDQTLACANAATNTLTTATTLVPTPAGGTWAQIGTTPTTATITGNNVTGMTVAGTYQFVYTLNGCKDTVAVTVQPCAGCVKPDAGPDQTLICTAGSAPSTATLTASPAGGTWAPQTGNPVNATVTNAGAVSGMTAPGTYYFIYSVTGGGLTCRDTVAVVVPNCNCNPPVPMLLTPSLTACIGDTFPTLKAFVVGMATVEWYDQPTGGTLLFTGLNFKPSGTVPAGGKVFYAQARSTDPSCPTAISSSRVSATVNAQNCAKEVDLALKKSISKKIAQIGEVLTYTLKVWNESATNATGVSVRDSIATTVQFVSGSFVASRGSASLSGNVITWNIGPIAANGDTVTLTYQIKVTQEGVHFNTAEICTTNEKDVDSTPCNHDDTEDDIDRQCFTVPFKLCPGEKVEVSVPANLTNVQWFKNGSTTPIASGNLVLLSDVGSYTFTATNQLCPANGCCPIIIEPGDNCCPVDLCIPFTIQKRRK